MYQKGVSLIKTQGRVLVSYFMALVALSGDLKICTEVENRNLFLPITKQFILVNFHSLTRSEKRLQIFSVTLAVKRNSSQ